MSNKLQDYSPPDWAKSLQNIPKFKVELAIKNTPIHEWNLPDLPDGFTLCIKRDDMTGSSLTGNKVPKLEFLMADAISKKCKHVITCGSIKSNHCRAVAVSARQLGLQPHLVMQSETTQPGLLGCNGNGLLSRLCGANIYLISWKSPNTTKAMNKVEADIKQASGERCYQIPRGGSNRVGLFGYIDKFEELINQGLFERFDDIVFTCGSGGTSAALAIANYLTGSKIRLHGVLVTFTKETVHAHINEMIETVGLTVKSEDIIDLIEGHVEPGYGKYTEEQLEFCIHVSSTTGIMLDAVYAGKSAKGLMYELRLNPNRFQGKRILYIHTGGIFGLYDGGFENTLKSISEKTKNIKILTDINA